MLEIKSNNVENNLNDTSNVILLLFKVIIIMIISTLGMLDHSFYYTFNLWAVPSWQFMKKEEMEML